MPDLKHSDLMQELKNRQEEIKNFSSSNIPVPVKKQDNEIKSFSSRFVSQTKPPPPGIIFAE